MKLKQQLIVEAIFEKLQSVPRLSWELLPIRTNSNRKGLSDSERGRKRLAIPVLRPGALNDRQSSLHFGQSLARAFDVFERSAGLLAIELQLFDCRSANADMT